MIEHTIYKEFIDKISELSDGIYPIITDLDNDLSYVPEKTADFFGLEKVFRRAVETDGDVFH